MAIDEAHNGVRVNALRPGNILTEIYYSNMFREEDSVAYEAYQNRGQWMGRSGQAIETGTAAVFLGSFVTGMTLLATDGDLSWVRVEDICGCRGTRRPHKETVFCRTSKF